MCRHLVESVVFGERSGRSWCKQRVYYVTVVFAALMILLMIRDAGGERLISLGRRTAEPLTELVAMVVSLTGTAGFTKIFGLPNRRADLNKEDRWEFPRWLDRFGHLLFSPWGRPKSELAPHALNQIQPNDETITPPILDGPNPSTTTTERLLDQAQQAASTIRRLGEK